MFVLFFDMSINSLKTESSFNSAVSSLETTDELVRSLNSNIAPIARGTTLQPSRKAKPIGYQRLNRVQAPWPLEGLAGPGWESPKPPPKRPTGRFFVGSLLMCTCSAMVWHVWSTFFSVAAYGVVKGDTLTISSPWEGTIAHLHFCEGQSVGKGTLLATLDSSQLQRKLDRLQDEIQVEQAKLGAETARLTQEAHTLNAQYFQMWASLQKSREELLRMQQDLEQVKSIDDPGVLSRQALNRLVFAESGQREFVEKVTCALDELGKRIKSDTVSENQSPQSTLEPTRAQLEPTRARIEYLNGEVRRTRDEIRDGEIRSPVKGLVVRCHAMEGQSITRNEALIEIIDQDSLKIELYVPQNEIKHYTTGKDIKMSILPHATPVTCRVVGLRNRFEAAPESIQQYYSNSETLMPVMLEPKIAENPSVLIAGSVTRFTLLQRLLGL